MHIIYEIINEHVTCMWDVYVLWVKLMISELCLCIKLVYANIIVDETDEHVCGLLWIDEWWIVLIWCYIDVVCETMSIITIFYC
jgi:hypothetical protein